MCTFMSMWFMIPFSVMIVHVVNYSCVFQCKILICVAKLSSLVKITIFDLTYNQKEFSRPKCFVFCLTFLISSLSLPNLFIIIIISFYFME